MMALYTPLLHYKKRALLEIVKISGSLKKQGLPSEEGREGSQRQWL
jgi:hypothetical protein